MKPFTITVAIQKGGIGKSTTCHALGAFLRRERRTLLIDADPQVTLTFAVAGPFEHSLYIVLAHGKPIREAAIPALSVYGDKLSITAPEQDA